MTRSLFFKTILSVCCIFFLIGFSNVQAETQNTGEVLESFDASGYTYLLVETAGQKVWVAIPAAEVKVGQQVTYLDGMVMKEFHSKTLDKTFESIIFSPGLAGATVHGTTAVATPASAAATPKPSSGSSFSEAVKKESSQSGTNVQQQQVPGSTGSAGATVPYLDAKVEKAPGESGLTVEEVFLKAAELNGKKVQVRGKVVKVSPNIMGKNWVHIQDGTGDPMKNSHDLVVTTTDIINVDDIVLVEGILTANKDFGFGYKYDALLEEASLSK